MIEVAGQTMYRFCTTANDRVRNVVHDLAWPPKALKCKASHGQELTSYTFEHFRRIGREKPQPPRLAHRTLQPTCATKSDECILLCRNMGHAHTRALGYRTHGVYMQNASKQRDYVVFKISELVPASKL